LKIRNDFSFPNFSFQLFFINMSLKHWILDENGRPVAVDLLTWAKWFETEERVIARETIAQNMVSTVFLGIDHNWVVPGPPILWETMTFGAKLDQEMDRCAGTKEQAEAMHEEMVKRVCVASGIPYELDRERVNDEGVHRRLNAVRRKELEKIQKWMDEL
jgi:hypothetical protein